MIPDTAVRQQKFDFHGTAVRVVLDDETNEPLWVATDVAKALGYRDAANMCRRLDDDEMGTHSVSTSLVSGGFDNRRMTVITEAGLYAACSTVDEPCSTDGCTSTAS